MSRKPLFAATFSRTNLLATPLTERVVAIVEFSPEETSPSKHVLGDAVHMFEAACWEALWAQYPIWRSPYSSSNPAPNMSEQIRHGFSMPSLERFNVL